MTEQTWPDQSRAANPGDASNDHRTPDRRTADNLADMAAKDAATRLAVQTRRIMRAIDAMGDDDTHDPYSAADLAAALLKRDRPEAVATIVASLAVQRQRIADLENDLATALGKHAGKHIGTLADGSRYEVTKSADRKAWDHDDWKRDVRRVVTAKATGGLEGVVQHTNLETGEVTETTLGRIVQEAVTMAQEVHGSTSPKSAALRSLGLYAGDYCEQTPGPWRVSFIKPDTTTPPVTATPKD